MFRQPNHPFKSEEDLYKSKDKQRLDNAKWANAALGKTQSNRYGDKLYDKSMEAGNSLKFFPKEKL